MKQVLLLIAYNTINYGTALQSYATQRTLEKLECEVKVLNMTHLAKEIKKRKLRFFLLEDGVKGILQSKGGLITKKLHKLIDSSFKNKDSNRVILFKEFTNQHLSLTKEYMCWDEVREDMSQYNVSIVGSDQLWLPASVVTDAYTLSFADKNKVNKISFATSFGIASVADKYEEYYQKMFNEMHYISVREPSGQKIVKKISGKDVPVVLDPVYMLETSEWNELVDTKTSTHSEEPYILCYFLGNNQVSREFAENLRRKTKLRIVAVNQLETYIKTDDVYPDENPFDVSPEQFLGLIRDAEYILTDSFHAISFCLIFHKKFWAFKRHSEKMKLSTNNRILALLSSVGLDDRLSNETCVPVGYMCEIDYSTVDKILDERKSQTLEYLKEALKNK